VVRVPVVNLRTRGTVALVVVLAGVLAACSGSEHTEIGACPIRQGSQCSGNYMRKSQLRYSVLFDANLDHADLTGVDLAWSNLAGASLRHAALNHADLTATQLGYADLADADLRHANLSGAVLTFTNFYGARLNGTRFTGARFCRTVMSDGTIANPAC
jgi:uncharacterized protein YjbI with pentapeptide repeats